MARETLAAKNQAIERFDNVFQNVAAILTGLLGLAGESELADKVRPSLRRSGRVADGGDGVDAS